MLHIIIMMKFFTIQTKVKKLLHKFQMKSNFACRKQDWFSQTWSHVTVFVKTVPIGTTTEIQFMA